MKTRLLNIIALSLCICGCTSLNLTKNPSVIIERIEENVPKVVVKTGSGSGVIIDKTHVLTAYHVVKNEKEISLDFTQYHRGLPYGYKIYTAKVVKIDEDKDLALLEFDGLYYFRSALKIKPNELPAVGESILVAGYPLGSPLTISKGNVAKYSVGPNKIINMTTTAAINFGNSGGPVIDTSGNIVGLIQQATNNLNINYAISSVDIVDFLKNKGK